MFTNAVKTNLMFSKYERDRLKCIDIGANLSDEMYQGLYNHHHTPTHTADLDHVLERAYANHVDKIIITGTCLSDAKHVIDLASKSDHLYATVGTHPTRCNEFVKSGNAENYLESLKNLIIENDKKVVAVGECGLDWDRLHFCPKEVQKQYFEMQLELPKVTKKPLFLHCRSAADEFIKIIKRHHGELYGGVVHSFTGTKEEAKAFTDLGYYIGINGCSLKTQENIDAMLSIPKELLMIETDCPWCEVKPTHAGFKYLKTKFPTVKKEKWDDDVMVKGRNEPGTIIHVLEIISASRGEDIYELADLIYNNTKKLFSI